MLRLPLTKMASRETDRLPTSAVVEKLNADKHLAHWLEVRAPGIPSSMFFLYHEQPLECSEDTYHHQFKLVQLLGNFQERVLLYGEATGITYNQSSGYVTFHGRSEKIGNYSFYAPYFERK